VGYVLLLVNFANGTPAYITRRFDYDDNGDKLNQEDFVSVLKAKNKYHSKSYQDVGEILNIKTHFSVIFMVKYWNIMYLNMVT